MASGAASARRCGPTGKLCAAPLASIQREIHVRSRDPLGPARDRAIVPYS